MKDEPPYFRSLSLSSWFDAACHRTTPAVPTAARLPLIPAAAAAAAPAARCLPSFPNVAATMTGIAAASFFSNACRFGGCGLHFDSLAELIVHIEDNHIGKRRQVNERRC